MNESFTDAPTPLFRDALELVLHRQTKFCGPFHRRVFDEGSDWIQVVGEGGQSKSNRLERDTAAACRWVQHCACLEAVAKLREPKTVCIVRNVTESSWITVRVFNTDAGSLRLIH